jgi:competence ComEA-like helix-hairpin-helix protein
MEPRPCLAALLLLVATWLPWGLAKRPQPPQPGCSDSDRSVRADADRMRGELPVAPCGCAAGGCTAPAGAAGLLLGRPIDIERAGPAELEALPGVGPGLARRIVSARERGGPFRTLEGLRRVKGVGAARIRALEGYARAGPAPPGTGLPVR